MKAVVSKKMIAKMEGKISGSLKDFLYEQYWVKETLTSDIAKNLDTSVSTIQRTMKQLGIELRIHQEQLQLLKKLNTGRKYTEESKINMSIGVTGSYDLELRRTRSEDNKRVWANMSKQERVARFSPGLRKAQINSQKKNISSIELKMKDELDRLEVKYIHQKPIANGKFILDFYLPEHRLVIECNGDYWHSLPDRIERDKNLRRYVERKGRDIVFIWEHEINEDSEKVLNKALREKEWI